MRSRVKGSLLSGQGQLVSTGKEALACGSTFALSAPFSASQVIHPSAALRCSIFSSVKFLEMGTGGVRSLDASPWLAHSLCMAQLQGTGGHFTQGIVLPCKPLREVAHDTRQGKL